MLYFYYLVFLMEAEPSLPKKKAAESGRRWQICYPPTLLADLLL